VLNSTPCVFLVAGNRLLRETLTRLLNKRGDFNVCGVSPCVQECCFLHYCIGCRRFDSGFGYLRDCQNCALISEIVSQIPTIKVILIDMDDDPECFWNACELERSVICSRMPPPERSCPGCARLRKGRPFALPSCAFIYSELFRGNVATIPSARIKLELGLTRRQQQLVPLISQGLTNKEIASHLNLSEHTVKNHIHGIMRRIGVSDRLQVIDQTRFWGALQ